MNSFNVFVLLEKIRLLHDVWYYEYINFKSSSELYDTNLKMRYLRNLSFVIDWKHYKWSFLLS